MSAAVLWLLVKLRGDHFLNICIYCKLLNFACLLHWPEHMTVTGRQEWAVKGMWKIFPLKLMQLLTSGHCRVRSGTVMENNSSI